MNWAECYSAFRRVKYDKTMLGSLLLNVAFWAAIFGAIYYGTR